MPETHLKPGQLQSAFCLFTGVSSFICTALRASTVRTKLKVTYLGLPSPLKGLAQSRCPIHAHRRELKRRQFHYLWIPHSSQGRREWMWGYALLGAKMKTNAVSRLVASAWRAGLCGGAALWWRVAPRAERCCSQGFLKPHQCSLFPKLLRLEGEELGN